MNCWKRTIWLASYRAFPIILRFSWKLSFRHHILNSCWMRLTLWLFQLIMMLRNTCCSDRFQSIFLSTNVSLPSPQKSAAEVPELYYILRCFSCSPKDSPEEITNNHQHHGSFISIMVKRAWGPDSTDYGINADMCSPAVLYWLMSISRNTLNPCWLVLKVRFSNYNI